MATLNVKIENGFFKEAYGGYIKSVSPTLVEGNGWIAKIKEDGSIFCEASKEYSTDTCTIRYIIQKDGFAKLTLKWGKSAIKLIKKGYVVPRGKPVQDGIIGLAGGPIYKRYAYFRNQDFVDFLAKYGITAVLHSNPNEEFVQRNIRDGSDSLESYIYTDGKTRDIGIGYDYEKLVYIEGATWTVVEKIYNKGNNHYHAKILCTIENPMKLDLSKLS